MADEDTTRWMILIFSKRIPPMDREGERTGEGSDNIAKMVQG